jgi:hypothetical protein
MDEETIEGIPMKFSVKGNGGVRYANSLNELGDIVKEVASEGAGTFTVNVAPDDDIPMVNVGEQA